MAAQTYHVTAVKSPMGDGWLGMITGTHFDGTPLTLYSVDDDGNMKVYAHDYHAKQAMHDLMLALAEFRFRPGSEIDSESLNKIKNEIIKNSPKDEDEDDFGFTLGD